jgi:plasmid stabilization system protein ParE
MEYRFRFAPRALAEANEAHEWIAEQSPQRAAKWYQGLFQRIETLATHPERCPVAPEGRASGEQVRQLLYGRRGGAYRILFVIRDDVIRIVAVRHGARQPLTAEQLRDAENV